MFVYLYVTQDLLLERGLLDSFMVAVLDSNNFWMQSGLGLLALSCLDQRLLIGL